MSDPVSLLHFISGLPFVPEITLIHMVASLLRRAAFGGIDLFWDLLAHNRKRRHEFENAS